MVVNFYGFNSKKTKKCFVYPKQIIIFAPTKDYIMARNNPKVAYLEEALSFIESIPCGMRRTKPYYLLEAGRYGDLGVQNTAQQSKVQIVRILGHTDRHVSHCHTWYY